ncbi:MAG: hypothetical protein ACHQF2_11600 [Flavobacteriales bacterium]
MNKYFLSFIIGFVACSAPSSEKQAEIKPTAESDRIFFSPDSLDATIIFDRHNVLRVKFCSDTSNPGVSVSMGQLKWINDTMHIDFPDEFDQEEFKKIKTKYFRAVYDSSVMRYVMQTYQDTPQLVDSIFHKKVELTHWLTYGFKNCKAVIENNSVIYIYDDSSACR